MNSAKMGTMTIGQLRTRTALFAAVILFGAAKPAFGEIDVDMVLDAIEVEYCTGEYWVPSRSTSAALWPVAVRIDGDFAYAWVERLDGPKTRWATFYAIARKGPKAVVTSRFGYNTGIMQENPGYIESRNKVFGEDWAKHSFGVDVRRAELKLPSKCTRVFAPDNPTKLAMIDAIQKSIAKGLPFSRHATRMPARVRIVIANFNADDGHTYVVVRETNEVFGVLLDSGLADAPADREYIVWEPSNASDVPKIRSKVLETGIKREIRIGR